VDWAEQWPWTQEIENAEASDDKGGFGRVNTVIMENRYVREELGMWWVR